MRSKHSQHDNTFCKILYENDQARPVRWEQEIHRKSVHRHSYHLQSPPIKVQDYIKAKKKSSCSYLIFVTTSVSLKPFSQTQNARLLQQRSTKVRRDWRKEFFVSFLAWLGNGLEIAASSRGMSLKLEVTLKSSRMYSSKGQRRITFVESQCLFIGILMEFSVVS